MKGIGPFIHFSHPQSRSHENIDTVSQLLHMLIYLCLCLSSGHVLNMTYSHNRWVQGGQQMPLCMPTLL